MKKCYLLCLTLLCLFPLGKVQAIDYSLTVDSNDTMTSSSPLLFKAENISPGFTRNYVISLENHTVKSLRFSVDEMKKKQSTGLLEALIFTFKMDNQVLAKGSFHELSTQKISLACLTRGEEGLITLEVSFPKAYGNAYQQTLAEMEFIFEAEETVCPSEEGSQGGENTGEKLPQTGESNFIIYLFITIIGVTIIGILLLLFLINKERKGRENEKAK